jgi:hypothetical protein
VLRVTRPGARDYRVPLNIPLGRVEFPLGLGLIFLVLLAAGVSNLVTKPVATLSGLGFTAAFMLIFVATERVYGKGSGAKPEFLEQFNQHAEERVSPQTLRLTKADRCLVAVRSPESLAGLERVLAETDPETTDLVIVGPQVGGSGGAGLSDEDRRLMTAVLNRAEKLGKGLVPLLVSGGDWERAVVRIARDLRVTELVLVRDRDGNPLDRVVELWNAERDGEAPPLTIRLRDGDRDERRDIGRRDPTP